MDVLVPVDFSVYSESALALAVQMGAVPTVLHVVHDPGEAPGYYSALWKRKLPARIEDEAACMLDDFVAGAAARNTEIAACANLKTMLVCGLPCTRIVEVAVRLQVRMIVMGSRGRRGLKRLMLGSTAERVVRLSPVPVTVVKN